MTTKFAAFFILDFSNSDKTFRFLLFVLGASSTVIFPTPFVTPLMALSLSTDLDGVLFVFRPKLDQSIVSVLFLTFSAEPFEFWAFVTISSGLGPANASDSMAAACDTDLELYTL